MAKENKALLRRTKGWKGFVHSYKNYIKNGSYDDMEWGKGTKEPVSVETTKMGKVIIKW